MNKDFIDAIFELAGVLRELAPPDGQSRIDAVLEKMEVALLEMDADE